MSPSSQIETIFVEANGLGFEVLACGQERPGAVSAWVSGGGAELARTDAGAGGDGVPGVGAEPTWIWTEQQADAGAGLCDRAADGGCRGADRCFGRAACGSAGA